MEIADRQADVASSRIAAEADSRAGKARTLVSPDKSAMSFVDADVDPLRYDGINFADPYEVPGIFRALMPENVRVLDVGCGTGTITVLVNDGKGNEVIAIEPDADRTVVARGRGLDVHEAMFDEQFLEGQEPFDVVMCSDVLEHLVDPAEALRLFARALKPGGLVMVSVPNVAHWSVRLSLLLGRFDYQPSGIMDATHLRWFTTRSLVRLFEACGFKVSAVHHTAGAWMSEYERWPFSWLPKRPRLAAVRRVARVLPNLLGCQHVVLAQLPG